MKTRGLTDRQARFVSEYLIDLNATQAAIRAGYSKKTAEWIGPQLLTKTHVAEAVAKQRKSREARTAVTADRVLLEAARLALFDPRKLFNEDGSTKAINELDDDTAAAIAGIKVRRISGEEGEECSIIEYKVADKNSALEKLFKHHGLYERDNRQKSDPIAEFLAGLSRSALPVAKE